MGTLRNPLGSDLALQEAYTKLFYIVKTAVDNDV